MQNKPTVLVAESDGKTCSALCSELMAGEYCPFPAETGEASVFMISSRCPKAVLLGRSFPDMDGLEVLRRVRRWSGAPIIMLAQQEKESDEVAALNLGADDYLVWPFGAEKLLARVWAVLRRSIGMERSGEVSTGIIQRGGLVIDVLHHSVTAKGCAVHLTQNEYHILLILARHPGKVIAYSSIITQIWGQYAADDRQILRVNVANIRKKLEPDPANPVYILTEDGVGYRLAGDPE